MKAAKKILVVLLALVLLMGIACAESLPVNQPNTSGGGFIQKIKVSDQHNFEVTVYDSNIKEQDPQISVSIDNVPLEVKSTNNAASWIFLVDTSTVSTEAWSTAPIIDTLKDLIKQMGDRDNGMICNPSTITADRTLSAKSELQSMSNDAMMETDDKNPTAFPDAVEKALNYLDQNVGAKARTNLVIISNGSPKGVNAESIKTLQNKVRSAGSVVYAVAYTDGNTKNEVKEAYLGLANASRGGKAIEKKASEKKTAVKSMIDEISGAQKGYCTASVSIPNPTTLATANVMTVTVGGNQVHTLTYNIPTSISSQFALGGVEEKSFIEENLKLIIIAGAGLLVVVAALIIVLKVVRKKKNDIVEPDDALPPPPISREVRVTLTREEDGEQFSAVTQGGICVVGRSSDADIPLPDPKMKISREHMQLSYENGIVMLADLGSRNHTFVNGIMVSRKTVMQQGDIIRMGDSEFRISWRQL